MYQSLRMQLMHLCSARTPAPTRHWLVLPLAAIALMVASAANAQPYVNVTVGGELSPGVYGHISVGNNNRPPPVINVQPVVVGPMVVGAPVMYVYAPPQHMQYWGQYCGYYRACGYPVQFVEMERHGRWWDHHAVYLRGPDHYRYFEPRYLEVRRQERHEERRDERHYDRRDNHRDDDRHDQRHDERGGHGRH